MEKVQTAPFTAFYDDWFAAQKKVVDTWVEATQTFQKSFAPSTATPNEPQKQVQNEANNFLNSWMEMQANVIQNFKNMLSGTNGTPSVNGNGNGNGDHAGATTPFPSPVQLKEWTELQLSMMQNFMEFAKRFMSMSNVSASGDKNNPADIYKQMLEWPQTAFAQYNEAARNWQNMAGMAKNAQGINNDFFSLYDKWTQSYNQMTGYFNRIFNSDIMGSASRHDIVRETLTNVMNSSATYMKLFEFLSPLYKAIQERVINPENFQFLLDPARYKDVMDAVFQFASPESIQEYFEQLGKIGTNVNEASQHHAGHLAKMFERNMALIPQVAGGDPSVIARMYENMYHAYRQSMEPFFKVPQEGQGFEISKIMKEISERSVAFATQNAQMQFLTYKTGQAALETLFAKAIDLIKSGHEIKDYNEVFRMWVDINERTFIDMFNTEEFSKLQAHLLENRLHLKTEYEKLFEMLTADLPIAPRSELDRVYKRLYEVDSKVHELEKELEATKAKNAAAAVATATSKKTAPKAE